MILTFLLGALAFGFIVASSAEAAPIPAGVTAASSHSETYSTPGQYSFTVPAGVSTISIDAFGAAGGNGACSNPVGLGGEASGWFSVTPGQALLVYVGGVGGDFSDMTGGSGGFNGGGDGAGRDHWKAGGGGGASDVRTSTSLNDRIVVGGGGGGAGAGCADPVSYSAAGNGGGAVGGNGSPGAIACIGSGGSQTSGGIGCNGGWWSYPGMGVPGGFGYGGNGDMGAWGPQFWGGGGGGGGWYGGGGDATYGGGGGSGYVSPAALSSAFPGGLHSGDGLVTITYTLPFTPAAPIQSVSTVQFSTPGITEFIVPSGVSQINADVFGAAGGGYNGRGLGGEAAGTLSVTPGQHLWVYVGGAGQVPPQPCGQCTGGAGGFNGGGAGATSLYNFGIESGSGGGGASDIRTTTALTDRLIVAGGGGGCEGSNCRVNLLLLLLGNDGGGVAGGGFAGNAGCGASGGTQTAPGRGFCNGSNDAGTDGGFGFGGHGSYRSYGSGAPGGGGGGGGWFGGGGSAVNPAGAGSGYLSPSLVSGSFPGGVRDGDGLVTLSWVTTVPDAPTSASASQQSGQATVTWAPPVSTGGTPLTGYSVSSAPSGALCTVAGTSATCTGLTLGTSYTFSVVAQNVVGDSTATVTNTVMAASLPDPPTAVTATRGDSRAVLSWTAPSSTGGLPLTGYTVTSTPADAVCTVTGTSASCVGLTNGTQYTFTVVATNAVGDSVASDPSSVVIPAGLPGAPTNVTAIAGSGSASVSWTAPADNGGAAITSYSVTSSPAGGTCAVTGVTANCTGLTNGTAYTFTVVATNSSGDSPSSVGSTAVTPVGAPSAPTNVTAVAGNGRATISWAAPTSDGGSPITGYAVSLQPGGATCSTTIGVEANPLTCSITGLVNGRTYSIQASSTNAYSASTSVSSTTVLGITDNGSALGTDSTGGLYVASADGYGRSAMITYYPWQGSPSKLLVPSSPWWPDQVTVDATSPTDVFYTDQGSNPFICAGVLWHFDGTTSTGIQPAGTCKPSGVVLDDSGHLYFQDVRRDAWVNAGDPVYYRGNATAPYNWVVVTSAEWQAAWDSQHGGGGDRATAILGGVTFSDVGPQILRTGVLPQGFVTPRAVAPSAPTDVTAAAGNASASISWTAPANDGGAAITSYAVTSSPAGGTCAVAGVTANCTDLTNGTAYTFEVVATNSAGNSPASAASAAVTPVTTPDAPTSLTATAGVRSASVSWTAPANNGGASITVYTVTSSPSGASCVVTGTSAACTGLANATSYTFTVVATNRVGNSVSSAASAVIATPGLPSAPTGVTATAGDTTAAVSWTASASDGGSPITTYVVTSSPAAGSCVVTGTTAACSGLTNGTAYTFTVKARSAVGDSAASTASNSVTPQLRPNSPTGLTVTPGNGLLTVKWTAATVRTGVAITGYTATATPGGFTCSTTAPRNGFAPTTCNIVGLVNGTSYVVSLVANSANGASSAVVAAAATPRTVPSAPGGVTGVAGNAQVSVSWLAPASNGGSPITGYTVTSSVGAKTCTTTGALTCVVTGLTNGTSYTFTVKATNAAGTSIATSASAGVVPIGAPTAPRTVTATANTKNHVVTVKWSSPTSTGGASIVGYTATLYNALTGGTVVTTCTTSAVGPTSPTTTCVMPAVAAGTYYVDVTATNASGFVSPASSPRTRIAA